MSRSGFLRVAVLVDLPRTPQSGGHVKCWERLCRAAVKAGLPLDLTVYFSGSWPEESLGPHARFRYLPPVLPTSALKFLPYLPDHTDLAIYHPRLANELRSYDLIHSTDGFFAFARTAARISQKRNIPLVSSIHTDTPSYTRIFTQQTITKILGSSRIGGRLKGYLIDKWKLPVRQGLRMERQLARHLRHCVSVLATRPEDQSFAAGIVGRDKVSFMRRGIDKNVFGPHREDRANLERDYGIPKNSLLVLFVGRVDIGKNIYTLLTALERAIAKGAPFHLMVAGIGPESGEVKRRLGTRANLLGFTEPAELGRLYASADLLAISSEVETHSMVATEALSCGCPVLIAKKSGVAEIFNGTRAMQVVDGGVDAWVDALEKFAASAPLRATMREAAILFGRDIIKSWENVLAEDLFAVWQTAAERSGTNETLEKSAA